MHDLTTGGSMTGTLHFVNKTPLEWFSKKQATSETAAHGSEFVAARTCGEQLIDMRTTFRCLGVPIIGHSHMFGDNESVYHCYDNTLQKRTLSAATLTAGLRIGAAAVEQQTGIPADSISCRSLRPGGATALLCVRQYVIVMRGRFAT